jgi:hypothetical protein
MSCTAFSIQFISFVKIRSYFNMLLYILSTTEKETNERPIVRFVTFQIDGYVVTKLFTLPTCRYFSLNLVELVKRQLKTDRKIWHFSSLTTVFINNRSFDPFTHIIIALEGH